MPNLSIFTPKIERGESRYGNGISTKFNRGEGMKALRKASESRRLVNRINRGQWSNECKSGFGLKEITFPKLVAA